MKAEQENFKCRLKQCTFKREKKTKNCDTYTDSTNKNKPNCQFNYI